MKHETNRASKAHITLYKGVILQRIHSKLTADGNNISIDETDGILKMYADLDKSCKDMSKDELNTLIEWSKQFATTIGLDLDDNNEIKINWEI